MRVMGLLTLASACLALGCMESTESTRFLPDRLVLLHTSDLHSRVWPFRVRVSQPEAQLGLGPRGALVEVGGWARLATLLERERSEGDRLWLDSGDALEGAAIFRHFRGEAEVSLLNDLSLGAMALGNHELALTALELSQLLTTHARFPVLSCNVTPAAGSPLAGQVLPSTVLVSQGTRIGLVGIAHPTSPPELSADANPWRLERSPAAAALQLALDRLSPLADVLVVLSHLGLDGDRELVAEVAGVDLVLGGHQHVVTLEPEWQRDLRGRKVPIIHSGAYGKLLSRVELGLVPDPSGAGMELQGVSLRQLPADADVAEEVKLMARLEDYRPAPRAPLAYVRAPIRREAPFGGDSALGNLVADAMREAAGADVALLNGSGLRADLEAGPLLASDLELALPFDEPWRLVWASARSLGAALEANARRASRDCASLLQLAGLRLVFDCGACAAGAQPCLRWWQPTPWGQLPLGGDEPLLVVLPRYLLRPGADFEHLGPGAAFDVASAAEVVARSIARRKNASGEADECVAELASLSPYRCREAFGRESCPLGSSRARATCRTLPRISGARDDRVTMLP